MTSARKVIHEGFDAFVRGASLLANPYAKPTETETERVYKLTRRGRTVDAGVRRLVIDYNKLWERGWQLAELKAAGA